MTRLEIADLIPGEIYCWSFDKNVDKCIGYIFQYQGRNGNYLNIELQYYWINGKLQSYNGNRFWSYNSYEVIHQPDIVKRIKLELL